MSKINEDFWRSQYEQTNEYLAAERLRHAEMKLKMEFWRLAFATVTVIFAGMVIADVLSTKASWM